MNNNRFQKLSISTVGGRQGSFELAEIFLGILGPDISCTWSNAWSAFAARNRPTSSPSPPPPTLCYRIRKRWQHRAEWIEMENRAATRTFLCRKRFDTIQFDSIWPDSTLVWTGDTRHSNGAYWMSSLKRSTVSRSDTPFDTWHSFFPPSLLLSFQRLEIKWKIDMEIKWNWDYWNLQRSGWIIIIIISDILFVFSTFFFFFNYREWFNQLHHMEYI